MATDQSTMKPAIVASDVGVGGPDRTTLIAFVLMVLAGSGTPFAIRLTYGEMPPLWSGTARFMVGALICWCLIFFLKIQVPKGKNLIGSILFGILSIGGAYILICWGLVNTTESLYQVLMALIPLLTSIFASVHGLESLTGRGLLGSLLAVVGIAIAIGGSKGGEIVIPSVLAILIAAVFMAEAGLVLKRFPQYNPIATSAVAMTVGSVMLLTASFLRGEVWLIPTQIQTWLGFGYMILISNLVTFLLFLFLVKRWTASRTSFSFVLVPLVTVGIASTFIGEQITVNFILGGILVLFGVLFGALLSPKTRLRALTSKSADSNKIVFSNSPCN